MKKLLFAGVLLMPSVAAATDSYVCIPDAIVGIRNVGGSFEGAVVAAGSRKLILSNASGAFRARWHGRDAPFMDLCDAQGWSCKFFLDGDGGSFSRSKDGAFLLTWGELTPAKQESYLLARGRCSKL